MSWQTISSGGEKESRHLETVTIDGPFGRLGPMLFFSRNSEVYLEFKWGMGTIKRVWMRSRDEDDLDALKAKELMELGAQHLAEESPIKKADAERELDEFLKAETAKVWR